MTDRDTTLRRLKMRSMRRGIKEMDLILVHWSDRHLETLSDDDLTLYEALLEENDQLLYAWVCGRETPPQRFANLVARISDATHDGVARP